MAPMYSNECSSCHTIKDFFRPIVDASKVENCDCGGWMPRIYSFQRKKEFASYYDDQYKCEVTSRSHESKLMKKHGHIDASDTKFHSQRRDDIRRKQRKPIYFLPKGK